MTVFIEHQPIFNASQIFRTLLFTWLLVYRDDVDGYSPSDAIYREFVLAMPSLVAGVFLLLSVDDIYFS
jgi:hypothetical protein